MCKSLHVQGHVITIHLAEVSPPPDATEEKIAERDVMLFQPDEKPADIWGELGKRLERVLQCTYILLCDFPDLEGNQVWKRDGQEVLNVESEYIDWRKRRFGKSGSVVGWFKNVPTDSQSSVCIFEMSMMMDRMQCV